MFSEYVWNSPCLKPLVFNPFIIAGVIILILYMLDLAYGKKFSSGSGNQLIQHVVTSYIIVATGIVLNNMIIKHKYRLDKYSCKEEKKEVPQPANVPDSNIGSFDSDKPIDGVSNEAPFTDYN
jgi:hypothetical protein